MNVIFAVDSIFPPLTGIGRYSLELAKRLPLQREIQATRFYSRGKWVTDPRDLLRLSSQQSSFRRLAARSRLAVTLYGPVYSLIGHLKLRRYHDFLFHSPNFILPPFPGLSVATIHDLSTFRHPEFHPPARVALLEREVPRSLRRADHLVAPSAYVAREINDHFGVSRASISVVPCGVTVDYHPRSEATTAAVLSSYGLYHGQYALCVATIEPRKNLLNLLAAYGQLDQGVRSLYPLVLCGDRGWHSKAIHDEIGRGQREGWLKYLGYVADSDLPAIYAGARILVYVPYYEGFGLPVLEGMASGIPVVAANRSALPELCGDCARLVEPEDTDALQLALEDALQDDAWRASAKNSGLALAAKYTWEYSVKSLIAAYRTASAA